MKRCPQCNQTFADDSLNFCLNDGSTLIFQADAPPTVFMPNANPTAPNQQSYQSQQNYQTPNYAPQQFGANQQYQSQMSPPKKSRGCLWAVLILGGLGILGFIAAIIGLAYIGSTIDTDNTNRNNNRNSTDKTGIFSNDNKNKSTKDTKSDDLADVRIKDDFSVGWWTGSDDNGTASTANGEYTMTNKKAGLYYIEMSPPRSTISKYATRDSIIRITVKTNSSKNASLGYGIIVHSNSVLPTFQGYCLLIRSGDQTYRIAKHLANKESSITGWKKFAGIRTGSTTNQLEVRTKGDKIDFYINGQLADSTKDTEKFGDGVIGLYTSDAVPVIFSDLQISDNK